MKKSVKKIAITLVLILPLACTNVTEEIYLNEDGSGRYLVYSDAIAGARKMMMGMMKNIYPEASEDSLAQVVENKIWAEFPEQIDSVIDFSSRVPDSIKNDPDKKKYLDKMEMFMKGSKEEGYLNSGMRFTFSSVEELQDFTDFLNENQGLASGPAKVKVPRMMVKYSFDGNSFSRTSAMDVKMEVSDSSLLVLGDLLKGSKARLILHLPRKVKSTSKGLQVQASGDEVVYEFEMDKVLKGELSTDIKVTF